MTDRKYTEEKEDNSFFDTEYRKYSDRNEQDSCATGSLTLKDLTLMFGMDANPEVLKDYETMRIEMPEAKKNRIRRQDQQIDDLKGQYLDEPRANYAFDPDELTIGELIAINEEISKQQEKVNAEPDQPYLSSIIAAYPGKETEEIAVISLPESEEKDSVSPFISIDEIIGTF